MYSYNWHLLHYQWHLPALLSVLLDFAGDCSFCFSGICMCGNLGLDDVHWLCFWIASIFHKCAVEMEILITEDTNLVLSWTRPTNGYLWQDISSLNRISRERYYFLHTLYSKVYFQFYQNSMINEKLLYIEFHFSKITSQFLKNDMILHDVYDV